MKDKTLPLTKDTLTIGRAGDCDLLIQDSAVSSHHARMEKKPDGQWLLVRLIPLKFGIQDIRGWSDIGGWMR